MQLARFDLHEVGKQLHERCTRVMSDLVKAGEERFVRQIGERHASLFTIHFFVVRIGASARDRPRRHVVRCRKLEARSTRRCARPVDARDSHSKFVRAYLVKRVKNKGGPNCARFHRR